MLWGIVLSVVLRQKVSTGLSVKSNVTARHPFDTNCTIFVPDAVLFPLILTPLFLNRKHYAKQNKGWRVTGNS